MLISGEIGTGCIVHIEAVHLTDNVEDYVDVGPSNKRPRTKLHYRVTRGHSFTEEDLKKEID
jgi:hypothetical protein